MISHRSQIINVYWETNSLMTTHGFQVHKYSAESILCYHSWNYRHPGALRHLASSIRRQIPDRILALKQILMSYCSSRTLGPLFFTWKFILQSCPKYNAMLKEFLSEEQICSQVHASDVVCEEQSSLQNSFIACLCAVCFFLMLV